MSDSSQLTLEKSAVRKKQSAVRKSLSHTITLATCEKIAETFLHNFDVNNKVISGFLPIGSEIDVRPLLEKSLTAGANVCLPCVVENNAPLIFRQWRNGDILIKEKFGTHAPQSNSPVCIPDIIITPLLAFDIRGYRLGYGGGFYDRTIGLLQKNKKIITIGVALEGQKIDTVPTGHYDVPLNYIITEQKIYTAHKTIQG